MTYSTEGPLAARLPHTTSELEGGMSRWDFGSRGCETRGQAPRKSSVTRYSYRLIANDSNL